MSASTILVVEDNDMMRKLLVAELGQSGRFAVEQAATREEGLDKAGAPPSALPDGVIEAPYRGLVSAIFRKPFDHEKLRETVEFCAGS